MPLARCPVKLLACSASTDRRRLISERRTASVSLVRIKMRANCVRSGGLTMMHVARDRSRRFGWRRSALPDAIRQQPPGFCCVVATQLTPSTNYKWLFRWRKENQCICRPREQPEKVWQKNPRRLATLPPPLIIGVTACLREVQTHQ